MNFRNKYLVNTIRILLGLVLLWSGTTGIWMGLNDFQGVPEEFLAPTQMLWDAGIFQMIKVTETVVGLMLLANFLPWLATLFFAPIGVGIIVYNARMAPAYLVMGVPVVLLAVYLGYAYWDKYKQLFDRQGVSA